MITYDIRSNGDAIRRQMSDLQKKHLPKAEVKAANKLGAVIHSILRDEAAESFDRPTPYTMRAFDWRRATPGRPVVQIWIKDDPNKGTAPSAYLGPQIEGGKRRHKRFERALITRGLMSPLAYAVPGKQAPLDGYGNVAGAFIVRMLSDLQAFGEQGYRANRKGARRGAKRTNYFFVPRPGSHLKPGVYWHMPNGMLGVVFAFVASPTYAKRYDFYGTADRAFRRYATRFMTEALAETVRSDNR